MSSGDYSVYAKIDGNEKLSWFENAKCKGADTEEFFKEKGEPYPIEVRQMCQNCSVKRECLTYAVKYRALGFWGGTTESDRREIKLAEKINASAFKPH